MERELEEREGKETRDEEEERAQEGLETEPSSERRILTAQLR